MLSKKKLATFTTDTQYSLFIPVREQRDSKEIHIEKRREIIVFANSKKLYLEILKD